MGTIADAYESGGQKAKEGTFSNLVMLARVDGIVDEAETFADLLFDALRIAFMNGRMNLNLRVLLVVVSSEDQKSPFF